jgi:hypothetical protein
MLKFTKRSLRVEMLGSVVRSLRSWCSYRSLDRSGLDEGRRRLRRDDEEPVWLPVI